MPITTLIGYIGLKTVDSDPGSGLFINDLPSISEQMALSIANSEQETAAGVWLSVQTRAVTYFKEDLYQRLRSSYVCTPESQNEETYTTTLDNYILENPSLVKFALWNLMGAELLNEGLNSKRANLFTLVNRDVSRELRDALMARYNRAMTDVLPAIKLCSLFTGTRKYPSAYQSFTR